MKKISFDIQTKTESGAIYPKNCQGFTFRNVGDVDAEISGMPLPIGEVNDDFKGYANEVIVGELQLKFDESALGTNPKVVVVRKFVSDIAPQDECKYKN